MTTELLFDAKRDRLYRETDRMFLRLLLGQWVFAIVLALLIAPFSWDGAHRSLHFHVKAAILFGGLINALPIALILARPGWWGTRQCVAVTQMLWSALLIMITGGRIETHFHVFGSLAFLAFYRDWKLLPTATIVVALDHLVRGLFWPDSVYGLANPEWWRFLEHAGWVAFEDLVLIGACVRGVREMREAAKHEAEIEGVVRLRTKQLEDNMLRYRELVENTAAVPFEYDTRLGAFTYLSPQIANLLDGEALAAATNRLIAAMDPGKAFASHATTGPIDFRVQTVQHRNMHLRCWASRDNAHQIRGVLLDDTRQQQMELELRQAQKLESVGRLAAGVAHEINTPIQFVGNSLEFIGSALGDVIDVVGAQQRVIASVLTGADATELAHEAVRIAERRDLRYVLGELPMAVERANVGAERVTEIVKSMKVFSHPDNGDMNPIDINQAILSTLTLARNEYKSIADVTTHLAPMPPVLCWPGEINQTLLNIVINAVHAVGDVKRAPGMRGSIVVTSRRDDDNVVISIADSGPGIPESIQRKIFDPFFTTKQVGKGTGQGLAIARTVVDKHRGSITFDTVLGRGTTFHIRIPIGLSQEQAA